MIRRVIHRPVAVSMAFLACVLLGVISYQRLPVDLLPSITYPRLTVVTEYPDIPAEDLERLVTRPIEEAVTAMTGVRRVTSRTREGVSLVTVEYEWGTSMDFANLHLREAVDRVAFRDDFPAGAQRPVILRWDPTARPISILVVEGDGPLREMTEFAEEVVKPAIQQVDGIARAEVVGGADREILVEPDPRRMAMFGVNVDQIAQALARANVSFPGGRIRQGALEMSLRIDGEFTTLDDIAATSVVPSAASPVRVADVAAVRDTTSEPRGETLLGSRPVVSLLVFKEPDANTIRASAAVDRTLEEVRHDYPDFDWEYVYRDAEYVRRSFEGLRQSLLYGAVLAFLVLLVFLGDLRSPLVVGLSIPVSIVTTFGALYFAGVRLNLMSLGGLSLAAGMLVDNAIVVLENVNRHLEERFGRGWTRERIRGIEGRRAVAAAAAEGTGEVARAVLGATLTTVAVFFPVVYVPGIAGAFFRDQALTVTFSLLVSVFVALLLQPMISARVLRVRTGPPRGVFAAFDRALGAFQAVYHRVLAAALRRRGVTMTAVTLFVAASLALGAFVERGFMPERSSPNLRLDVELPAGTPLEETTAIAGRLADRIGAEGAVEHVFVQVGTTERSVAAMREYTAPNTASLRIILRPSRRARREARRIERALARRLDAMPGVRYRFREEGVGLAEVLGSDEAAFVMGIVSEDPFEAVDAADRVLEALRASPFLRDLQVDRVIGAPTVVVHLDADEIARAGLDPQRVATELRGRIAGIEATTFNEVEKRIDVAVRLPRATRRDLAAVLESPIELRGGKTVPLRRFLDLRRERPVRELVREDQRRMVSIVGDVARGSLDDAWRDARARVATLELPPGVRIVQGGERVEMLRSFHDLVWAMLLAAVLVYMILAAQFESFLDPLLIAAVLPVGIGGAFIAIAATGNTINVLSLIGMVALLGIAVNDAIIKVDTIRRLRADGMAAWDAIFEASRIRLRPILMTSATTVLAMVPMAIGVGSGEQIQRPLAVTIIGGLTLTTALTLVVTPLLYSLAHRLGRCPR